MKAEFLLVYLYGGAISAATLLRESLALALEDNEDEETAQRARDFIQHDFERHTHELYSFEDGPHERVLYGFTLDLPEEIDSDREILNQFCDLVGGAEGVDLLMKFHDSLVEEQNLALARELFALEMRLRRAISVLYFNAYREDYFHVLREETVKPMEGERLDLAWMRAARENEFFHLTFSQYKELNRRKPHAKVSDLADTLGKFDTFEAFRNELLRPPIQHKEDQDFLAALKEILDPVEKLRNRIAHNRTISSTTLDQYQAAKPRLEEAIESLFARYPPMVGVGD